MAQIKKTGWFERLFVAVSGKGGPRVVAGVVLLCIAVAVAGLGVVGAGRSESLMIEKKSSAASGSLDKTDKKGTKEKANSTEVVVVDVGGAVASPQVVRLESGARVDDAIQAAGGLSEDADISSINRASKVEDGAKVYVPRMGETAAAGGSAVDATDGTGSSGSSSAGTGSGSSGAASGLVNINTAGLDELDTLPGVGPSTAQSIIDDRTQNGPFSSIEDLMRVSGIGEKKFANMKSGITI